MHAKLTSPLDHWWVTLVGGEIVDVAAHGTKERDDFLVFTALIQGTPNREIAVAAFPASAVSDWGGGETPKRRRSQTTPGDSPVATPSRRAASETTARDHTRQSAEPCPESS
jgi:hypothetical protein